MPSAAVQPPQRFIQVNVYDTSGKLYSYDPLYVYGIPEHKAGYSYNYNLTVGKDTIAINSVKVTRWTGGVIEGGEAKEDN